MALRLNDLVLVNQPTATPTRKMQAVGVGGAAAVVIAPALTALVIELLPGLSAACGKELGFVLTAAGGAAIAGLLAFFSGYRTRNRATDVGA